MILITRTMRDVRNHRMGRARLVWSTYVVLREDVDTTACNELSQFLIFVICYCHQMCPWTLSDMQSRVLDVMSDHRYITNLTSNKFPSIGEFWRNITESTGWVADWSDVSVWGDRDNWEPVRQHPGATISTWRKILRHRQRLRLYTRLQVVLVVLARYRSLP